MNDIAQAGIPAAVLRQGKAADEAMAKIAKGEAVTIVGEKEPVEEPAAPVKPAEPAKVKPDAPEPSEDTWKAKYNALKGKYDAEVPRLSEQLAELQETARRQQATIDTLLKAVDQGGGAQSPAREDEVIDEPGKAPTHTRGFGKVNKENFAGYGDEVLEMVDTINFQDDKIRTLEDKLAKIEGTVKTSTKNTFLGELARLCPNWEILNKHEDFYKRWLYQKDVPRARNPRVVDFDHYVEQQDAAQVASFFNDYIEETGWKPDGSGRGAISRQAVIEEQIVPAPDVTSDASNEAAKQRLGFPIVTREQLAKATRDRVAGRITEEEFNKISDNCQRTYAAVRAGKLTL